MYYVIVSDFDIGENGFDTMGVYNDAAVAYKFFNEPFAPMESYRKLCSAGFVNGELVTDYDNPISKRDE